MGGSKFLGIARDSFSLLSGHCKRSAICSGRTESMKVSVRIHFPQLLRAPLWPAFARARLLARFPRRAHRAARKAYVFRGARASRIARRAKPTFLEARAHRAARKAYVFRGARIARRAARKAYVFRGARITRLAAFARAPFPQRLRAPLFLQRLRAPLFPRAPPFAQRLRAPLFLQRLRVPLFPRAILSQRLRAPLQ